MSARTTIVIAWLLAIVAFVLVACAILTFLTGRPLDAPFWLWLMLADVFKQIRWNFFYPY